MDPIAVFERMAAADCRRVVRAADLRLCQLCHRRVPAATAGVRRHSGAGRERSGRLGARRHRHRGVGLLDGAARRHRFRLLGRERRGPDAGPMPRRRPAGPCRGLGGRGGQRRDRRLLPRRRGRRSTGPGCGPATTATWRSSKPRPPSGSRARGTRQGARRRRRAQPALRTEFLSAWRFTGARGDGRCRTEASRAPRRWRRPSAHGWRRPRSPARRPACRRASRCPRRRGPSRSFRWCARHRA